MSISKEELLLEEQKLDDTIKEVDALLKELGGDVALKHDELREFQRLRWEMEQELDKGERWAFLKENDLKINVLEKNARQVNRLIKVRNNPYFGSIVFNDEDIYVGITSVKKDMDYSVYDWRAPICSMFYDYGIGKAQYESPAGIESGYISRKRQYKIENAKLRHVFDTNINIDDDVLQTVLAENSSDKMKNIVNTIQAEQNQVIRNSTTKNIVVQGIAGSGKTSVALHRIAFLLYKIEYLTSNNILIFSPNNIFTEYISDVLPDLGEDNTMQTTFHDFASSFISEYYRVESYSSFVERFYQGVRQDNDLIRFKLSDGFILAIQEYVDYLEKHARFIDNFSYQEREVAMDDLNQLLYERYSNKPLFERVELIAEKINNTLFKGRPKELLSIRKRLYEIANFKKDYRAIYRDFFDTAIFQKYYPYMYRKKENVKNIAKKVINYEDATPFIYLKCLLEGYPYQVAMRHVVIDEAQDYTYLQYMILQKIFKNASFTILGDVNQTVNPFYKYATLEKLLEIFTDSSMYVELTKTYRSSPEIIEYANKILGLSHVSAIRHNLNLPVLKRNIMEIDQISEDIKYLKSKYKSVAIITKSIERAKDLTNSLKEEFPSIVLIDIHTQKFSRNLVIAPAYSVKGLEFDAVIIINDFEGDDNLNYVVVTRSEQELIAYE